MPRFSDVLSEETSQCFHNSQRHTDIYIAPFYFQQRNATFKGFENCFLT